MKVRITLMFMYLFMILVIMTASSFLYRHVIKEPVIKTIVKTDTLTIIKTDTLQVDTVYVQQGTIDKCTALQCLDFHGIEIRYQLPKDPTRYYDYVVVFKYDDEIEKRIIQYSIPKLKAYYGWDFWEVNEREGVHYAIRLDGDGKDISNKRIYSKRSHSSVFKILEKSRKEVIKNYDILKQ